MFEVMMFGIEFNVIDFLIDRFRSYHQTQCILQWKFELDFLFSSNRTSLIGQSIHYSIDCKLKNENYTNLAMLELSSVTRRNCSTGWLNNVHCYNHLGKYQLKIESNEIMSKLHITSDVLHVP
ncbi:hypothetical protein T4D_9562 [Trichinella pseudospiralis]|uniref:Uncharacterized protein n=1 Tax=Trichinella pseudospiralis TaxID=6337 RepID=A0A0V1FT15_TRIPS|nr:hypothetical protein T4D_9562 [Trichinella pseudospiralis]